MSLHAWPVIRPLLVPTWSQTWLIFNPHLPQDKQYKENILVVISEGLTLSSMVKWDSEHWDVEGRVAQASVPQRLPMQKALSLDAPPGFRKRGFVPKVLYPEISQTRPAPKQQDTFQIKTSELS